ncbi:MAG TPA: valine--tRNA ligase [Candidatus Faecalibacterium faecigallinarum]|uniref:Valine--tRNA ligase n=1 Tax=Candidatus Faecalibacterium faecigallinarum TaxID=2838577 RepID=A0A9D2P6B1_9FIRM|nr:valine--tRNA ligase [Candidatus Faecalibacterium faecigallinarum]
MKELAKQYDPSQVEDRIYQFWLDGGYFHAKADPDKKPYTIVMPPPNVTGQLHMGHAVDNTMQDILIRHKRMQGYAALWVPGTDHASIATEAKVVEAMAKEGLTKEMVGRDGFLERAWDWKNRFGSRIVSQLKKLGSSCDWERERFTMDEGCSDAVREVFVRLYDQGLIYRGNRMVNWCPHCNTSISDAEVEYAEQDGHFWHLLYPVKETGEMLELATTRPETMLGDTAVAINPDDPRYAHLHGCHVILPLLNKEIPIVCDEHADMTKGTGVVKITPAHDPNDFEVGLRHDLPIVRVFTYDGHMTGKADKEAADALFAAGKNTVNEPHVLDCGKYAGMTTMEARKAIVADLEAGGYLKSVEPLKHEVGSCYRCHTTIEPMVSKQWFVKMEPLAKPAIEAVEQGRIRFVPERFTKNYMNWMKNTRDWCISRQLWWGHQIPAWYCDECGETVVAKEAPAACPKCGCTHLTRDPDTLDTWFSSALWPFSTLGWPNQTEDLSYFYPTDTLVTGYDIIGFWVSRMIFSGLAYTGKAPFHTVCIHGIVRDSQGRKMSKSLGNGIDPLEVIAQYGADALRFMLVDGSTPGNDMRYSEKKVEAARNFANKLWNATRFVLMNLPEDFVPGLPGAAALDMSDKWVLTKLGQTAAAMTDNLDHYELGLAAAKINAFIWDVYCDWFIEIAKPRLNSGDAVQADTARRVLVYVLSEALKLLHPFMPFITEELYQALPGSGETIMTAAWPTADPARSWPEEEEAFEKVMDYIKAVRTMRTEMNVHPAKRTSMVIETADPAPFQKAQVYLAKFAFATDVSFTACYEGSTEGMVQVSTHAARGFIPMMELIDRDKELARLEKEKAKAEKELAMFQKQLANPKFVEKAPAALVEETRAKAARSQDKLANIEQSIRALG